MVDLSGCQLQGPVRYAGAQPLVFITHLALQESRPWLRGEEMFDGASHPPFSDYTLLLVAYGGPLGLSSANLVLRDPL